VILCIDIGNTSIKLARVGERVRDVQVISSRASLREIERAVARAARGVTARPAIASVRPRSTPVVRLAVRRVLGVDPFVITHRAVLPIEVATRRPERVGADRICAACGALSGRARNGIIVDVGSAITVDLVLDRRFVGGLIMPGPQTMLSALHHFTARLPMLDFGEEGGERIDDTAFAMLTGARVGAVGAIEAAVRLLQRRAGRRPRVWVTGGHARHLSSEFPASWTVEPHLTLRGIARIARLIQPRSY
jgi:type III pantothenate kinase